MNERPGWDPDRGLQKLWALLKQDKLIAQHDWQILLFLYLASVGGMDASQSPLCHFFRMEEQNRYSEVGILPLGFDEALRSSREVTGAGVTAQESYTGTDDVCEETEHWP